MIDLGSNSWRLVVYSYQPDPPTQWWKETDELYETVRIGEGMGTSGALSEAAMDRGLETLIVFDRFCRAAGLSGDDVHVIATSAIRDASNQHQFLERIKAATGYDVEVLSAHDEAHYGYVAAVNTTTLSDGIVLDIGGGSMQLIQVVGPTRDRPGLLPARRRPHHRAVPVGHAGESSDPAEGPAAAARSCQTDAPRSHMADSARRPARRHRRSGP